MDPAERAKKYVTRLRRCLKAVKAIIIATGVCVAALIVFAAVAAGTGLKESDPAGMLIGVLVPGFLALAGIAAALIVLLISAITVSKLKKLDGEHRP